MTSTQQLWGQETTQGDDGIAYELWYTEFDMPSSSDFVMEDIDAKLQTFHWYKDQLQELNLAYWQAIQKNKRVIEWYKRTLSKLSSWHKNYSFFYKKTLSFEFNSELLKVLHAYLQENIKILDKAIDFRYPNIEFLYPSDYWKQKTNNYFYMKEIFVRKLEWFNKWFNDMS